MPKSKRNNYCRCCGGGKDHNFPTCKNFSAMRKIILEQDNETHTWIERAKSLEPLEAELKELKRNYGFMSDILSTIISLYKNRPGTA